ncbi:uncharacterized protein ARMOST_12101 [Armillaria ostoyae]|uniref:Uncharacterized protein n=1 Tax=Armillaria ostoyae TaxID=47428 RepID=A0A284RIY9_ARMOS|nr:uncharacterized protein ARMOST_12101 [Armillaria ostoyae]
MQQKRGHDDESTIPNAKRLKLAELGLRQYKALLKKVQVVRLILDAPTDDDSDQEEQTSFEFSEVTRVVLKYRLGFRFSQHDWTSQGMWLTVTTSKYYTDNLKSLLRELENICASSEFQVAAAYRLVATTFLSFVIASIKEKREIQIKAAIKARIESTPDFDIKSLMPLGRRTQYQQMLSAFLESQEKAGVPSTSEELSVDDKVEFIWWNNDRVTPSGLLDLDGVKDSCHIRLVQGIVIDPDSDEPGASFRDQNGRKITLSGVVDYGMFVYKTLDEVNIRDAGCYHHHTQLSRAESLEARLIFVETAIDEDGCRRDLRDDPLAEASAQALALSARFKLPNVRFIVTNSEDWVIASLHNPPDGEAPEVVSYRWETCRNPFKLRYGSPLNRDNAMDFWRTNVRDIYAMLMEWFSPENMSTIPSPPPLGKGHSHSAS